MSKRIPGLFACLLVLACSLVLPGSSWATTPYTRYFTVNRQTSSITISSASAAGTTSDGRNKYNVTLSSGSFVGYSPYENIKDSSNNYFYILSVTDDTHATIVDMKWNGSTHTPSTGTGTVGEAYSTLSGVEGRNRNLTTDYAKEVWYVSGQKGVLSDNVSISGWTTDSTRHITIKAFPGHESNGTYSGAMLVNAGTDTPTITVATKVVYIDDLAVASNGSNQPAIKYDAGPSSATLYVRRSVIKHDAASGAALLQCGSPSQSAKWYLINCVVYSESATTDLFNTGASGKFTAYLYNDTFFGGDRGIVRSSGTVVCKNCYVGATSTSNAYVGTFSTSSTNNVTWDTPDHTPSIGSNPLHGCSSYANYFVSTAAGAEDFHWRADSYALFGASSHGADLSADSIYRVSDDIDRQGRLPGYFDYGADQTDWAPIFTSGNSQSGAEGTALSFTVSATDPEGGAITYSASSLPSGAAFNASTRTFSWTPAPGQGGIYGVTFTATDGAGRSRSQTVTITISHVNQAPVLSVPGAQTVNEAQPLSFSVSATDPDGDTLTYSASNLPNGASFDSQTRTFSWTPAYGQAGTYSVTFSAADSGTPPLSDTEAVAITVNYVNRVPVLSVPGPQTVNEAQSLTFSVSATDPDAGQTLTYSASGLPAGAGFNASTHTFSWTPAYGQAGTYSVTFSVTDSGTPSLSDTGTVTVTVGATNRPPVLSVPGAQLVNEGAPLTFTLGATDPDSGQTLTYAASGLPSGATFNPSTRTFSWTPAYGQAGTYSVTFNVTDNGTPPLSDTGTVQVTVNDVNRPPVLNAVGNKSVAEGQALSFTLSAADPDGDTLTYAASNLPPGASFDAPTATFTWTPGFDQTGTYPNVTFTVTDNGTPQPESDSEAITITVTDTNRNPVLSAIGNKSVAEAAALTFTIGATDPDAGQTLTYSASGLPTGASFDTGTATFAWTPGYSQSGSYEVTFTATDDGSPQLSASEAVTIAVADTNRNPILAAIGNKSVAEGATLSFGVSGSDPDTGQTLTYSASGLPSGALFDPQTAAFTWTPGFDGAGIYTDVTFTVTDNGNPPLSASEQVSLTVTNTNRAPVLGTLADQSVAEGTTLSYTVPASDPDSDPLTHGASGLPGGASFDPQTHTLTWTPGFEQAGTYSVTFTVSDATLSDSGAMTISVSDSNRAPVLAAIPDQTVAEGAALVFSVSATDPDGGQTLSYAASNLPDGASFDPATRTFAWTPDYGQAGTYYVLFTVSDGSLTDTKAAAIGVSHTNRAPTLAPIGNKTVSEGQSLTFSVAVSDPDEDDTLSLAASNLPTGAVFDPATGRFTWTPAYWQSGSYQSVLFTVTDNGLPPLADSEAITITVGDVNRAPSLDPVGNKTVDEGQTLAFSVSGTDPDSGQTLSFAASNLPTGAAFDPASHSFNWTPSYGQSGNYQVTFTVTDDGVPLLAASEEVTISVGDVNRPPALSPIGSKTANEGQTLIFAVTAADPDGDDILAYAASNLPEGATFEPATQTFAWTPSYGQAGNYQNIIFTVADNGVPPAGDSEAVTISVGDVNRPPALNPIGSQAVNEGQTLTLSVTATDPDGGDMLTYWADGLPDGAFFDPATQSFNWTPTYGEAGNYQVVFTVTDSGTPPASASQAVTISVGDVNRPPVLYAIGHKSVFEGETLTFTITASDPDGGQALTCTASGLPAGATFDPATQTFTWTAPPGWESAQVTFTVTDNGTPTLSVSETITITVRTLTTIEASLAVKPNPVNLASKPKRFTVLIGLPPGYSASEIVPSSLQLSLPDCPDCGINASPAGALQVNLYAAKFERAFLRQAPLGGVWIRVAGRLTDGTLFAGMAVVEGWKPISVLAIQTLDATGKPEWQFAANEAIVFTCDHAIDPRIGEGLKVSLLIEVFGQRFASPWQPAGVGEGIIGYSLRVPPEAGIGVSTMKVTLRLRQNKKIRDTVVMIMPVEVLEHSKLELP